jgi:gas vesicle protein
MLRLRTLLGAVVGGSLVYFFDPKSGAERRARLRAWLEQSREPVLTSARETASAAQDSISQLGDQAAAKATELRRKASRSGPGDSAPYDTQSAGTAGTREDTGTHDLPERFRTYEGQDQRGSEGGDLPAPR